MNLINKVTELTIEYMNKLGIKWINNDGTLNPSYKNMYDCIYINFYRKLVEIEGDIILGQKIWI